MERAIMWMMAVGALLGAMDKILGNPMGLGKKFEQGFELLGPTALSMAGVLCLVPLISGFLGRFVSPLCHMIGLDPAMLSGLIAIDMGGYPLAMDLAKDPALGRYFGVIVAATLGCTLVFTLPIGMGMLKSEEKTDFARGLLFGLVALPAALLTGGLLCGISLLRLILQSLPVLIISLLVLLGLLKRRDMTIRAFTLVAKGISILATLGLALGAFAYLTGTDLLPGLAPIQEAMAVVSGIGIVMLGSLPVAELIQRALKRPLNYLGARTGMNGTSVAALFIGAVSVLPAIAMMRDMDRRGRVVNAASVVCSASALAAQLGYVAGVDKEMILPLLAAKFAGGICGALAALAATRRPSPEN